MSKELQLVLSGTSNMWAHPPRKLGCVFPAPRLPPPAPASWPLWGSTHLEVGCGVGGGHLRLPVVEGQVCGAGHQPLLALKVGLHVLALEPGGAGAGADVDHAVTCGRAGVCGMWESCEGCHGRGRRAHNRDVAFPGQAHTPIPVHRHTLSNAPVSKVYVPRDLLRLGVFISYEDDGCELPIANCLLSVFQCLYKHVL